MKTHEDQIQQNGKPPRLVEIYVKKEKLEVDSRGP